MSIKVTTRKIKSKWWSSMTYKGYDWSESGCSPEDSQNKIRHLINKRKWMEEDFDFQPPIHSKFRPKRNVNNASYKRPFIDFNPLG